MEQRRYHHRDSSIHIDMILQIICGLIAFGLLALFVKIFGTPPDDDI